MIYLHLRDRWKLWRWRAGGHAVSEMSCRRCGYPVRALESSICPECGADRNRVGTIAPLPPLRADRRVLVAAWLMVLLPLAWAIDPLLYQCMPRELMYMEDCVLQPRSSLYGPIEMRRVGVSAGWGSLGPYARRVEAIATFSTLPSASAGNKRPMEVQAYRRPGGTHAFSHTNVGPVNSSWQLQGPLNREFVLAWIRAIPVDVDRPDVQAEISELARLMTSERFTRSAYTAMEHFDVLVTPTWRCGEVRDDIAAWIRPPFWTMIALAGAIFILRRPWPRTAAAPRGAGS